MRRLPYLLSSVVVVVVLLLGGGYLALHHAGQDSTDGGAGATGDAAHVSSVQMLGQQAPSPATSASQSAPASPAPGSSTTSATPKPPAKTTPPASSSVVNELLAQINQLRAQNGLPAYTLLAGLNASAHKHNLTMMAGCGLSHQCPGEASFDKRISAQGVKWTSCGENIGYSGPHPNNSTEIVKAAEGLTTSMYNEKPPDDGHRRNLLSTSFHHVGIDVVRDSSGKVWLTQDFSS